MSKTKKKVKKRKTALRYFFVAVILGILCVSPSLAAQSAGRIFNLDEAITHAITNNFDILVLEHEKEIQAEVVQGSLLRMLPSLVLEAERSWKSDHVPSRSKNYATGEESLAPSISSDLDTKKESVGLSWNLLNLALEINRYRQEKTRGGLHEARLERFRQNIALDVIKVYLRAQIAKKSADLAVNLRGKIEERLAILRGQIEKSTVNGIEGIENEINLLILQYRFHSFETNYKNAKSELAKLMGLPPDADFELEDLDFQSEAPELDIDLAAFDSEALAARPELMEIDVTRQITREEATGTLVKMFPTLTPFVKYEHNANSFLDRHDWQVTGLKFSWNLLTIPRHMSDRRIAKGKVRKQAANRKAVAAAILTQVRLAAQDYREIDDAIVIVKKIARKRKQLIDAVNRMVRAGQAKEAALLEVEQRYLAAQIDYYSTYAKLRIAVAKINNTLGRNWGTDNGRIFLRATQTRPEMINAQPKQHEQQALIPETASAHKPSSPKEKIHTEVKNLVGQRPAIAKQPKPAIYPDPANMIESASKPKNNIKQKAEDKFNRSNSPHTLAYSIVPAHFRNKKYAEQAVKFYTTRGINSYMVPVNLKNSGKWWRIYTGFFHDKVDAMEAAKKNNLADFQIIEKTFTNLINTYSSKKEIEAEMNRIQALGFYPYQVEISPTEYKLLIGAYSKSEDAKRDSLALRENGIECRIVRR